jgi:hypothetical protein
MFRPARFCSVAVKGPTVPVFGVVVQRVTFPETLRGLVNVVLPEKFAAAVALNAASTAEAEEFEA